MQIYRVAGYAKLAKLWERDPDRARSFHREFFEKKYAKPMTLQQYKEKLNKINLGEKLWHN